MLTSIVTKNGPLTVSVDNPVGICYQAVRLAKPADELWRGREIWAPLPIWEEGGREDLDNGFAVVWADERGEPPPAIMIKRKGHRACGEHALVSPEPGYHLVIVVRRSDRLLTTVWKVKSVAKDEKCGRYVHLWLCPNKFKYSLRQAIVAAEEKAVCWHCRLPHYISNGELCPRAMATRKPPF